MPNYGGSGRSTGLPSGGSVGQTINNTGPGNGTWQGDTAWTQISGGIGFQNSWVDDTGDFTGLSLAGYRIDGAGRVQLRGAIKGGGRNTVAFTLPAGYRPVGTEVQNVATLTAGGASDVTWISITSDGKVTLTNGAAAGWQWVTLNGVSFWNGQ